MEAAKYQRYRPRPEGRLALRPGDLRTYRRAPESEYLLALLLDHTCRGEWDWTAALGPFLRWGYVRRAAVCVVEVGGAGAPASLQAERLAARSLLDPRVAASLARRPGSATPLAHGLTSVLNAIRHAMQHGRALITEALLVVVTDGLGNVPLSASLDGQVTGLVTDEGVTDALRCAAKLGELDRVRCVCVAPPKRAYPTILSQLTRALAATLISGDGAPSEEPTEGAGSKP
jgi:magnesium chelatase subunit D